jgi:hypothetical protein
MLVPLLEQMYAQRKRILDVQEPKSGEHMLQMQLHGGQCRLVVSALLQFDITLRDSISEYVPLLQHRH